MDTVKDTLSQGYATAKRALSSAPPNDAYLRWDAPGVEEIKPEEEAKALKIAETLNEMQKHNFDKVMQPQSRASMPALTNSSTDMPSELPMSRPKASSKAP